MVDDEFIIFLGHFVGAESVVGQDLGIRGCERVGDDDEFQI